MSRFVFLVAVAATLAACGDSGRPGVSVPGAPAQPRLSSNQKDSVIKMKDSLLSEKTRQLSEQSQLIGDATTTARLVSELDRDISQVRGLRLDKEKNGDKPELEGKTTSEQIDVVGKKVRSLIARLNTSESRLRKMRDEASKHARVDSTQIAQLAEYERSLQDLRATVERQKQEIAMLTQRVDSVVKVNTALTVRNTEMAAREDSVFVAIGSKKDLLAKGIVRQEGGTKLFFGRGKTLVPARDIQPQQFQLMSKSRDLMIPLPRRDKAYRIVSRHSLHYADPQDPRDASVYGTLKITDATAFWSSSKYLILVER
jgi:hypothetical protein